MDHDEIAFAPPSLKKGGKFFALDDFAMDDDQDAEA